MRIYREKTHDYGYQKPCYASDNYAEYQLTSAYAHDAINDYLYKFSRWPSARWYNRHFRFERIK